MDENKGPWDPTNVGAWVMVGCICVLAVVGTAWVVARIWPW